MEIELKNGEKLTLEVTPLLLEYIEDYEGGIEQLKKDAQGDRDENGCTRTMRATNHILYSIVASNYKELLTYRQAVGLVKLEDIESVVNFAVKNTPEISKISNINNFKHRL